LPLEIKLRSPKQCSNLILRCDYREEDFNHWPRPSELDLAHLAARLAGSTKGEPKPLAARAWKLYWECCKLIQEDYRKVQPQLEFDARGDDAQDYFDAPA
jgi:hypothetical protein